MQQRKSLTVSLNQQLISQLDAERGLISRSAYIESLLRSARQVPHGNISK